MNEVVCRECRQTCALPTEIAQSEHVQGLRGQKMVASGLLGFIGEMLNCLGGLSQLRAPSYLYCIMGDQYTANSKKGFLCKALNLTLYARKA
jgi:hypothetical protein